MDVLAEFVFDDAGWWGKVGDDGVVPSAWGHPVDAGHGALDPEVSFVFGTVVSSAQA